ncbi:hypothetical protein [Novosphingobium ginsenosidimutans]|uniref:Uncharacterized protein n=1 Tax=Novosphingobium ginsenosidimutans TaxID=1176536 RepID=A0A5B8S4H4_9SPHN|nr:hypothetical protein [Novosphingobium ginsenosidimutans]QEA16064.1 hypothetical protein FRF71_07910 [Novosphingobium ginsenosidimutans]
MAGGSYSNLPAPKKPYRLGKDTRHVDGVVRFRDLERELRQDKKHCKVLEDENGLNDWEIERARDLRSRLHKANETGVPAETLASAVYHREARMPILGGWWKLVETYAHQPQGLVTLRPQGFLVKAADLYEVRPRGLVKRLKNDFERNGINAVPGFGFFGLDADFDANRDQGVWDFHFHGIVVGEKLQATENLREARKYKNHRIHPLEQGLKPSPRVQVKEGLYNLPDPITYCLESWVPHRPTTLHEDGTRTRSTTKSAIPSPYLQQWLIWMDLWSIEDFIALSNLTPTKEGFRIMSP